MIFAEILNNNKILIHEKNDASPVSDSVKFESIRFGFPNHWQGYTKTAVFTYGDGQTLNIVLSKDNPLCLSDEECYIPYEVLLEEEFYLSVFGVLGESIATTPRVKITVTESGYALGEAPLEPTENEYQQIIAIMRQTQEIAQSVRDDADNGLFNGKDGSDGAKGEKGDQGIQGEKGDKGDQGIQGKKGEPFTYEDFTEEQLEALKGEPGELRNVEQEYNPESDNASSSKAISGIFASAIETGESGDFLTITDISPIKHDIDVQISVDTNGLNNNNRLSGLIPSVLAKTPVCTYESSLVRANTDWTLVAWTTNSGFASYAVFVYEMSKDETVYVTSNSKASNTFPSFVFAETLIDTSTQTPYISYVINSDTSATTLPTDDTVIFTAPQDGYLYVNTEIHGDWYGAFGVEYTNNGITYTLNSDGSITANGTATGISTLSLGTFTVETGAIYYVGGCPEGVTSSEYRIQANYTPDGQDYPNSYEDTGSGISFTATADGNARILIYVRTGTTLDAVTFEPYFLACFLEGITISRLGKNLFDGAFDVGSATINSTNPIRVKPNTDYVISAKDAEGVTFYIADGNNTEVLTEGGTTFNSGNYNTVYFEVNDYSNYGLSETSQFQIEEGTTPTEFEEYDLETAITDENGTCSLTSMPSITTVFAEDEDVVLNVKYNVDTKKYIDRKIAEAVASL